MPTVPLRRLLPLVAVVLAAHLLLLRATPGRVHLSHPPAAQAFITRSIPIAAAPAAERAQPRPVPPPRHSSRTVAGPALLRAEGVIAVQAHAASPAEMAPPQIAMPSPAVPAPAREPGAPAVTFVIPGSMRLHYQVTAQVRGQAWSADGELVWHHDGESYEAMLQIRAPLLPTRTQRSAGRITAAGLAPLRFSDKSRSEEAAHFQRDKAVVSFSSNRPDAPLLAGAQDRLSVMLQLGAMIAGAPRKFPPGATIAIQTAGTRDAEPWLFTVEQEEELQLPGGTVGTLRLTRLPRREYDQKVELWLAPAMDYAPVRLRLTQPNGDSVDQQWASTDKG